MTRKVLMMVFAILLIFNTTALANPTVFSDSAILMEAETGQILFEKNAHGKQYPASITKVLTAIVALEHNKLDDIVVIGDNVPYEIEAGSSAIYLLPQEKLTIEQLMYGLLVESANDAAVAIAQHTSGSVAEFAQLMNAKAKELGTKNSNFVNPNGLHDDNHYTTAHDMALIMREAIKNPTLLKMMTTVNYTIPATNKQQTRYLWTKNKLFKTQTNDFYYDKTIASKTGYTTKAGNTLVSAASENDMNLVTVVLKSNGQEIYKDTIHMFQYGFENFQKSTLVNKDDFIKEYKVKNASSPLKLVSRSTLKYISPKAEAVEIQSNITIAEDISPSVKKGEKIGTVEYTMADQAIGKVDLVADNEVESQFKVLLGKIAKVILTIFLGLIALYIILRVYVLLRNKQIRRRRKRRPYGMNYMKRTRKDEYSKY